MFLVGFCNLKVESELSGALNWADFFREVISIGDSEIERWAAHDLPFSADPACEGILVKTVEFYVRSNSKLERMSF